MPSRSPARFLAPLALVAAVVTIYLVSRPELSPSPSNRRTTPATTSAPADKKPSKPSAERTAAAPAKSEPKMYTVKPGDVLGSISEATGIPVADLLDYNDIDAQSLRVGQKLKLAP